MGWLSGMGAQKNSFTLLALVLWHWCVAGMGVQKNNFTVLAFALGHWWVWAVCRNGRPEKQLHFVSAGFVALAALLAWVCRKTASLC